MEGGGEGEHHEIINSWRSIPSFCFYLKRPKPYGMMIRPAKIPIHSNIFYIIFPPPLLRLAVNPNRGHLVKPPVPLYVESQLSHTFSPSPNNNPVLHSPWERMMEYKLESQTPQHTSLNDPP